MAIDTRNPQLIREDNRDVLWMIIAAAVVTIATYFIYANYYAADEYWQ